VNAAISVLVEDIGAELDVKSVDGDLPVLQSAQSDLDDLLSDIAAMEQLADLTCKGAAFTVVATKRKTDLQHNAIIEQQVNNEDINKTHLNSCTMLINITCKGATFSVVATKLKTDLLIGRIYNTMQLIEQRVERRRHL
jgi:hypothetical protein